VLRFGQQPEPLQLLGHAAAVWAVVRSTRRCAGAVKTPKLRK
jgi:hypothetical protein